MAIERNRKSNPIKTSWLIAALLVVIVAFFALEFMDFETVVEPQKEPLIELDTAEIYEVDFHTNNPFYRITKELTEVWKINDSIPINQEKVADYLAQFDKITAPIYSKPFDISKIASTDKDTLIIKSTDLPLDLKIYCYKNDQMNSSKSKFILQTSQDTQIFFQGTQSLVDQIFKPDVK